ncbi:hypothetical protein B7463_g752, partial [Scytalidium lignicola]
MDPDPEEDITTAETAQQKRPSIWKTIIDKLGLNIPTVLMMLKGAVAPTIGVAIYQNRHVAEHYSTIGYLIPIMSILTVPIMPRARFIQNFLVTCLLICLAAALSLFAMWCSIKARQNTTHIPKEVIANGPVPGAAVSPFNAASSVNMAIWFFFWVWLANTFRAYRPQYFLPSIVFSVFINATVTRLLESFFAGFGISFATSIFVLPFSSRALVSMLMKEELHGFKKVFKAHTQYILSLPTRDWYCSEYNRNGSIADDDDDSLTRLTPWPEADLLKNITAEIANLQVKIKSELRYVKREVAWGKLYSKDYEKICDLLKNILLPILGMDSLTKVADRIEKRGGWGAMSSGSTYQSLSESEYADLEKKEKEQWLWMFEKLRDRVRQLQQAMLEGIDHVLYSLELEKRPKASGYKDDVESNRPEASTTERLEKIMQDFLQEREGYLKEWCASKGMSDLSQPADITSSDYPLLQRHQTQLYLFLDLEYSFLMAARGILELLQYADSKIEDGTMSKSRLILPGWRQMRKWLWAAIAREDNNLDYQSYSTRSGTVTVRLHDVFQMEKDAEHLPPTTAWERISDKFLLISNFFGSPESAFGFRVAVATMCIAIVAYLRNSQQFYIEQRLIWGSIMVAISMSQTAGSGIYGQFLRFAGTALAMVASYIDWYIVDQHTAGIIVFLGITMFLYHYPLIKFPENPVVPMIGMVTVVLIVGYELQVKQVGIPISVSNGQVYHPLYEIAPYRLATVLGGVGVAFFFTYFPSVVTTRSMLRKDLASSLYILGNYYSVVYQTIALRIEGAEGSRADKHSPGRKLDKARSLLFAKELILLQGIKHHNAFTAWEPSIGGKFPRATYNKLVHHTQNIMQFTTMICYVTQSFDPPIAHPNIPGNSNTWVQDFHELITSLQSTSRDVMTLISIIASAIGTGKPLPPYLEAPSPVRLSQLLDNMNPELLSTEHVGEPGYAALAVMQVATAMLNDDLHELLKTTKKLVGEAKFSVKGISIERIEDLTSDASTMMGVKQD